MLDTVPIVRRGMWRVGDGVSVAGSYPPTT